MRKLSQLLAVIFTMLFALSAYSQDFVVITKSNNGQTINLSSSQVLEIRLPKTPSNGYTWCESNSADKMMQRSIAQIGDGDFIHDGTLTLNGRMAVGQAGTQIIRYAGASVGTTVLTLELKRPWQKDSPAIDNFSITVVSGGLYKGSYVPPVKDKPEHKTSTPKSLPSKWDWRTTCTAALYPITDQGQCGDCWAFAGVATFEANIIIRDGASKDISEAYLTNCDTQDGQGCNGGWCPHQMWVSPKGAVYESQCPWTTSLANGSTGSCGGPYTYHEHIDSYADVAGQNSYGIPPDANMKNAIYNYGPIWVAIDASSNGWNNYSGGIWTESGSQTDHAVALVGWCDSTGVSGGGYWILRNSWTTGWGINGYMYISYGSDLVGTSADYIVYKGGIPHNVPPVADFSAAPTSSCTGTIQFQDLSTNVPTSWLWNFGDGSTSTAQNPSHTYASSGTYNVSLSVTNSYGNNSKTQSSYISINLSASPTTTGASCQGPCSVTLNASGNGTLYWYSAPTGGTSIHQGTSYTTPTLSTTTTYYVQSSVAQAVQSAGLSAKTTTGGYYTSTADWALIFNAMVPLTINTVKVYANGAGNRTIWLKNSSGTKLYNQVINIPNGTQTLTLNFNVPAGTGYQLGTDSANNLWRDNAGAVYPFTTVGLISITGNTAQASGYYYYFYNWQVQPTPCLSARVPVVATITGTTGISENGETNMGIYPNPNTGKFEIQLSNAEYQDATLKIINMLGETVLQKVVTINNVPLQIDVSNFEDGIYFVKLQTDRETYLKKVIINKKSY